MTINKQNKNHENNETEKNNFKIIINLQSQKSLDNKESSKYTTKFFSMLSETMFVLLGIILFFASVVFLYCLLKYYIGIYDWSTFSNIFLGIGTLVCFISLTLVGVISSVFMFKAVKEQIRNSSFEKTIAIFSGLISLVALVISFIALSK